MAGWQLEEKVSEPRCAICNLHNPKAKSNFLTLSLESPEVARTFTGPDAFLEF